MDYLTFLTQVLLYDYNITVFILVILVAFVYGCIKLWPWFHILILKTCPIQDIQHSGSVEVQGTIKACAEHQKHERGDLVFSRKAAQYYKHGKHGGWKNSDVLDWSEPFFVSDGVGQVLVSSDRATIDLEKSEIFQNDQDHRTVYYDLGVGTPIYVMGYCEMTENLKKQMVKKGILPLLISNYSQKKLLRKLGIKGWLPLVLGVVFFFMIVHPLYARWNTAWEGTVIEKNTYRGRKTTTYHLMIRDNTGHQKERNVRSQEYNRFKVGDSVIKKAKEFKIEVQ